MILIGQYDSPFVRRVAVALHVYGLGYEHRPWSSFSDADAIGVLNPLRRVPTLILDDGEVLIESGAILDHLDEVAGLDQMLLPAGGSRRRAALKLCALATGLCDKMVSLVYERVLHDTVSSAWIARCETQIIDVLDHLETWRADRASAYWLGDRIGHGDIITACAMRFLCEAHSDMFDPDRWPTLTADADQCESLAPFRAAVQPFLPPKQ